MTIIVLIYLFRHSAKVVKAASQVLSSMWQYRDLRSLYKKVRKIHFLLYLFVESLSFRLHVHHQNVFFHTTQDTPEPEKSFSVDLSFYVYGQTKV